MLNENQRKYMRASRFIMQTGQLPSSVWDHYYDLMVKYLNRLDDNELNQAIEGLLQRRWSAVASRKDKG